MGSHPATALECAEAAQRGQDWQKKALPVALAGLAPAGQGRPRRCHLRSRSRDGERVWPERANREAGPEGEGARM